MAVTVQEIQRINDKIQKDQDLIFEEMDRLEKQCELGVYSKTDYNSLCDSLMEKANELEDQKTYVVYERKVEIVYQVISTSNNVNQIQDRLLDENNQDILYKHITTEVNEQGVALPTQSKMSSRIATKEEVKAHEESIDTDDDYHQLNHHYQL